MKKSIASLALFVIGTLLCSSVVSSCATKAKQDQSETQSVSQDSTSATAYACSMHPEVTGKKGDKCSKCGMDLVEAKKSDSTATHH